MLPAAFSAPLTVGALRFTWVVATNFPEDFHLQVDVHAGHTSKTARAIVARAVSTALTIEDFVSVPLVVEREPIRFAETVQQ